MARPAPPIQSMATWWWQFRSGCVGRDNGVCSHSRDGVGDVGLVVNIVDVVVFDICGTTICTKASHQDQAHVIGESIGVFSHITFRPPCIL